MQHNPFTGFSPAYERPDCYNWLSHPPHQIMLSVLLLHFPVVAGLVVGALTGFAIQHHSTFLQFVLSSVASLFVMIASLMYLSVMPDSLLECEGWDCIEKGGLFDILGLMGASLTFAAIVITISLLRLIAYKSRNDRHYWTD